MASKKLEKVQPNAAKLAKVNQLISQQDEKIRERKRDLMYHENILAMLVIVRQKLEEEQLK